MANDNQIIETKTPSLTSEAMLDLAEDFREELVYWKEARIQIEEEIWRSCDNGYHCYGELPEAEGMDWADVSDRRETDLRDGVNSLAEQMTLALLPRDESAFQVVSSIAEEQGDLDDVRDLIADVARKIDLRGEYEKHVRQCLIRGTSAIHLSWRKDVTLKTYDEATTVEKLMNLYPDMIIDDRQKLRNIRFQELAANRPVVKVIDMVNLLLDPNADLGDDDDLPFAMITYKTPEELKAKDSEGNYIYDQKALADIEPMSLDEIRGMSLLRFESVEKTGLNPLAQLGNKRVSMIPVALCHRRVRNFQDMTWYDCYFYVALSHGNVRSRIIRVQQNPDPTGGKCLFIDTYRDWIAGTPYGTGAVEHSLQAWNQKNVLSALTLNAQLATVFPAMTVIGGILQEDRRLKLGPGAINIINRTQYGTNVIAPIPGPQNGVVMGMKDQQFLGQKILGQMGAFGSIMQDPTKSLVQAKTATEINTQTSSGSVMRDNLLERMTIRSLEPLINAIYRQAQRELEEQDLIFQRTDASQGVQLKKVEPEKFRQEGRRLVVTGFHGLLNKQQEVTNLREALAVMGQGRVLEQMPQLVPVFQETIFKLLGRLGVKNLEQYKKDPAQLIMSTPSGQQAMQQVFQQGMQAALQQIQQPPVMAGGQPNDQPPAGIQAAPAIPVPPQGAGPAGPPDLGAPQGGAIPG